MSKKLLFIYNPLSGTGTIKTVLSDVMDILIKAGFETTVYPTQSSGDATVKVAAEAAEYDRIICSGGDGTLDEVVTGLLQSGVSVPIGYIPAGSTNDFASTLGIDGDILGAARIAATGHPYRIDIGRADDDYFVYVAAFGIFTEASYQTSQEMKNLLGHAAYVLEGVKQLRDVTSYRMQVEAGGNVIYDDFVYGMVTNADSVGGFKGLIGENVNLSDGVFEVTLVKMPKNPIELNDILAYISGRKKESDFVISFQTDAVKFTSADDVPWTYDGEFGCKSTVLSIKNIPQAVEIIVE